MSWRGLLPSSWRDAVLPRLSRAPDEREAAAAPPWQPPALEGSLRSHRFEHGGAHHRLQLRRHRDGSGLVVVDARRIARVDGSALRQLDEWIAAGAPGAGAPALEQRLWGEPVLTGCGSPRAANAWEPGGRELLPVPEIPLVATIEVTRDGSGGPSPSEVVRALHGWGVPHVVLRALESAASSRLAEAVQAAEDLGLVAGAAGAVAAEALDPLAAVGVDHLGVVLAAGDAATNDGIVGSGAFDRTRAVAERAARLEIPLTVELPLLATNWSNVGDTLAHAARLGALGVTAWALVDDGGSDPRALAPRALRQVAATLEQAADGTALSVTWAAAARARDVAASLGAGPRTEGDFGLRVRGDGSILPPRGSSEPAGRIGDAWSRVEASPSWQAFLAQARRPTRCDECPGLVSCAVDCPADPEGWS